jgi:hypothetical protein
VIGDVVVTPQRGSGSNLSALVSLARMPPAIDAIVRHIARNDLIDSTGKNHLPEHVRIQLLAEI